MNLLEHIDRRDTAYRAYIDADKAWSLELQREYGNQAGDKRYTSEGVGTPELRRLYAALQFRAEEYRAEQANYMAAKREFENVD